MLLNSLQYQNQGSLSSLAQRLQIEYLLSPKELLEVEVSSGSDVIEGLTHQSKFISCHYRYDNRGSQLFEQVCSVPEYYLTRTETGILQSCASKIAYITGECELVELGSGSAVKTRTLLNAYKELEYPLHYLPIDISAGILETSSHDLLVDYPSLQVQAFVSTYELAMQKLAPSRLSSRMICFLGSTLGGLTSQEYDVLLTNVTNTLQSGEYFLLGIDLQKPKHLLEAAYNDSQGVNAQFNFNILHHLNWRFQGNFDSRQFAHHVVYNESSHQVELCLRSLCSQSVHLNTLNLEVRFELGELISTGFARKFNINAIEQEFRERGLKTLHAWTDTNQWYGLLLCQRQ